MLYYYKLTSCSNYNSVMRDHLCDRENYDSYRGIVSDIYYLMDSDYFFIAAIADEDTEYFRFEDGFRNVVEYIDKH